MGVSLLNVWVSEEDDPCGTWNGAGQMSVLDCNGVLQWNCGRYLNPEGKWVRVPRGEYLHLPFKCGHIEVELPPGCYWVVAGYTSPEGEHIHFNGTTHVGIVEVGCGETGCVKLFNPSVKLCWDWFHTGLRILAANPDTGIDAKQVAEVEQVVAGVLERVETRPIEETVMSIFGELVKKAGRKAPR